MPQMEFQDTIKAARTRPNLHPGGYELKENKAMSRFAEERATTRTGRRWEMSQSGGTKARKVHIQQISGS